MGRFGPALRGSLSSAAVLAGTGAAVAGLIGALAGVHNDLVPHVPRGTPGALAGIALGAVVGVLAGLMTAWGRLAAMRAVGGAAFGALVGAAFGLRVPGIALPSWVAGAALGGACLALARSRAVLVALACTWASGVADPATSPSPEELSRPLESVTGHDVNPRTLEAIAPGAVLEGGPPAGWSHLVLAAHYQVHSGDVDRLPRAAADAVASLFACFAANVEADSGGGRQRYRLAGLGVGMATRIGARDVIVSGATQERLGAHLDVIGRRTLAQHEKHMQGVLIKARSDTMAVFDNPNYLLRDGRHHPVVLRFGLLVDPGTGRLDTLLWRVDGSAEEGYRGAVGQAEWLPPGMTHHFLMHADAREFTFGLPVREAILAIPSLPPGHRQVHFPEGLRDLAGLASFTPAQAADLERGLRETLARQE